MLQTLHQQLTDQAARALAAHGLVLVSARLSGGGSGGRTTLQVLTENPDGSAPGIDDCARASRTLGAQLDVLDLLKGRYTLEVSSPGLERPLSTPADYRRFIGRHARLTLSQLLPVGNVTVGVVIGHLIAADDQHVTVAPEGISAEALHGGPAHVTLPYTNIRYANLHPSGAEMTRYMQRQALPGEVMHAPKDAQPTTTEQPN